MKKNKKIFLLSICIPTYNRPEHLENCLYSIAISKKVFSNLCFEVCISDNSDTYINTVLIKKYNKFFKINFHKNKSNIGYPKNYLKVIKMAKGKFVWVIGDDEILHPNCFKILNKNFKQNLNIDFLFINSNYLNYKYLLKFKHPFNTFKLPKKMNSFSNMKKNKIVNFFQLIDPNISWDFLLGISLSIYNRKKFISKLKVVNKRNLYKTGTWSTFENTAFYTEVYAAAFNNSKAYIQAEPLIVSTHGHKSWDSLYPFILIIRIPELLDIYRKYGLNFFSYVKCKNYALRNFISNLIQIYKQKPNSGLKYISIYKNIILNLLYPNVYLSVILLVKKIVKKSL